MKQHNKLTLDFVDNMFLAIFSIRIFAYMKSLFETWCFILRKDYTLPPFHMHHIQYIKHYKFIITQSQLYKSSNTQLLATCACHVQCSDMGFNLVCSSLEVWGVPLQRSSTWVMLSPMWRWFGDWFWTSSCNKKPQYDICFFTKGKLPKRRRSRCFSIKGGSDRSNIREIH